MKIEDLLEKVTAFAEHVDDVSRRADELKLLADDLQSQVNAVTSENVDLRARVTVLEGIIAEAKAKLGG